MKKSFKIVIVWRGVTGYASACWRALAQVCDLTVVLDHSPHEQAFDAAHELAGICWTRELTEQPADVVVICGWRGEMIHRAARMSWGGAKKVLACDMPWEWTLRKFLARFVLWPYLRHFDAMWVPGRRATTYARWLGFGGRTYTGMNTSGWERFSAVRVTGEEARSRTGFLFAGRNVPEKGVAELKAAYARYCRAVKNPWPLDWVGSGFTFVAPDDMPQAMRAHACLIQPSLWEPWGVAVAEAMSAGLLTIATTACGVVDDLPVDVVVKPGDVRALCDAMVAVQARVEKGEASALEQAGCAAEKYSIAAWVEGFVRMCTALGAGGPDEREESNELLHQ